jgi:hypothetical protein
MPPLTIVEEAEIMMADVVSLLRDEDRKPRYQGHPNILYGQCYVASETLYWLLGGEQCPANLQSFHMTWKGESHWFICLAFKILDPTAGQFDEPPGYLLALSQPFQTPSPSNRTRILMRRYYDAKLRGTLPSQRGGDCREETQERRGAETMGGSSTYGEG